MEDIIKVFVVHVHAMFSSGCAVHALKMGKNTRWKITKYDVMNFLV
jgi:hypothetical protein